MNFEEEVKEILGDMANFPESEGKELFIIGCYKKINALAKKTALGALPKEIERGSRCLATCGSNAPDELATGCTCGGDEEVDIFNTAISQAEENIKRGFK